MDKIIEAYRLHAGKFCHSNNIGIIFASDDSEPMKKISTAFFAKIRKATSAKLKNICFRAFVAESKGAKKVEATPE